MADDINVTYSTETESRPVATDEVSGRHYQWVKLAVGGEGAATPLTASNPLSTDLYYQNINELIAVQNQILKQLKIMNFHLMTLTDCHIDTGDLDG